MLLLIILQTVSCVSTQNVAEIRNDDFRTHNNFEEFKIWHEIDIARFYAGLLNIHIALIPEDKSIQEFDSDSQLVKIYDSLKVIIDEKMNGFQDLKKMYFDTTVQGKTKIYANLKSDSSDNAFLEKIEDNLYYELYKDIIDRLRKSILQSGFYSSQKNFQDYLQNRSIQVVDIITVEDIFGQDVVSVNNLSENQIAALKSKNINFLIAFSAGYNVEFSDRAQSRVGSETTQLILFDVFSGKKLATANITRFWGSE
jgi:hypothetical protein